MLNPLIYVYQGEIFTFMSMLTNILILISISICIFWKFKNLCRLIIRLFLHNLKLSYEYCYVIYIGLTRYDMFLGLTSHL